jgi:hypothetical protein
MEFLTTNKDAIVAKFNDLCLDLNFDKTLSGGLQSKSAILKRRKLWLEKINNING